MQKKIQGLLLLQLVLTAFISGACSRLWDITAPPYKITKPVYRLAGPDDICNLGGVFFDFYNRSQKKIVFIETKMQLMDSLTGFPAFANTGLISTGSYCQLQSGDSKNLCISLDDFLSESPVQNLLIENFYVSKIEYADGTMWKDLLGVYADPYNTDSNSLGV